MDARYYDPTDRRFLTQDSYRGDAKEPYSLNLYAYCANDPVNRVDVEGHRPQYIDEQSDETVIDGVKMKDILILNGKGGDVANNGCGAIAVYNVMVSQGYTGTFQKVLSEMQIMIGRIGRGILRLLKDGFDIFSIRKVLKKLFSYCKLGFTMSLFDDQKTYWTKILRKSCAIVVRYEYRGGAHYIAGIPKKIREGKYSQKIRFYNWETDYQYKYHTIRRYLTISRKHGLNPTEIIGVNRPKGGWDY